MKIIFGKTVFETKVLDDDGNDITSSLNLTKIEVVADTEDPDGLVRVKMDATPKKSGLVHVE